jgi:hypothetical protein
MEYGGHQAKDRGPMRAESDAQRCPLEEHPQEQAEDAEDEHGEVPDARPMMTRGMLVRLTHPTDRGLVLPCVLRVASALRRVAHQVQSPEYPVAQQQRENKQQR